MDASPAVLSCQASAPDVLAGWTLGGLAVHVGGQGENEESGSGKVEARSR